MSFSACDFVEAIVQQVPLDYGQTEDLSEQCVLACDEIQRMQRFEKGVCYAVNKYAHDTKAENAVTTLVARLLHLVAQANGERPTTD